MFLMLGLVASSVASTPWLDPSLSVRSRAEALAAATPLKDVPAQLACGNFGCDVPIPSLNVSGFDWSGEACHGLLLCGLCGNATGQESCDIQCPNAPTVFPQVIAMASSFNVSLFRAVGSAISTEARAFANINDTKYFTSKWAPNMNLLRYHLLSYKPSRLKLPVKSMHL